MYPWQPTNLTVNRTNLRKTAAIRTAAFVKNIVTENLFLQMVKDLLCHLSLLRLVFGVRFDDFLLKRIDRGITRSLVLRRGIQRGPKAVRIGVLDRGNHLLVQN